MDCIFCKIVKGEIPSYKVYEDNDTVAFLDVFPVTRGHCLVIPKAHAENIFDIAEADLQKIISVTKTVSEKVKYALGADGIRLSQSNGKMAGQEVMHLHMHIIPRYKDDGISMSPTSVANPAKASDEELKEVAQKIS